MAICILGDLHLRDDKDYFVETCEQFLEWFRLQPYNNKENTLILLGDLVERALLSGRVAEYLERFIKYSQYKDIHIIVGNHDLKRQYNTEQLAYHFYVNKPHIHIHYNCEKFIVEGKSILAMPHFNGVNSYNQNLVQFYSTLTEKKAYQEHYDLALGHFNCDDISFGNQAVHDIEKLDADRVVLGHIHGRDRNPDRYLGSVFAGKVDENDNNRAMLVVDGDSIEEYRLPKFNEFLSAYYPEELPKSDALVPIYKIYNCTSESIAREKYGNIFIQKTIRAESDVKINKSKVSFEQNFSSSLNIKDILRELLSNRPDISQNAKNICNRIVS